MKKDRFIAATCNRCGSDVWNDENHHCPHLKLYSQIDALRTQLAEARDVIETCADSDSPGIARAYLEKYK